MIKKPMQFIDSHSHLDFNAFDSDRDTAITRAKHAGVSTIVVSGTTATRWPLIKKLCDKQKICYPAYGLHPLFMSKYQPQQLEALKDWVENESPIAIGEIGLDFFIDEANGSDKDNTRQSQLALFIAQLEIADSAGLPVIIHARKSLDIVLKQLRLFPRLIGSIHSFSGSEQQAKQLIDLGFYLGFGGPITYTRATKLRKLASELPLESLLLETDAPDQPDALHFKERNEPAYIKNVAHVIAELRGIEIEEVAHITSRNAHTLFAFKPTA